MKLERTHSQPGSEMNCQTEWGGSSDNLENYDKGGPRKALQGGLRSLELTIQCHGQTKQPNQMKTALGSSAGVFRKWDRERGRHFQFRTTWL